jgi:hypothetical protein
MPPAEFEPAIPASERPNIDVLDSAATGISPVTVLWIIIFVVSDSKALAPYNYIITDPKHRTQSKPVIPATIYGYSFTASFETIFNFLYPYVCLLCKRFVGFTWIPYLSEYNNISLQLVPCIFLRWVKDQQMHHSFNVLMLNILLHVSEFQNAIIRESNMNMLRYCPKSWKAEKDVYTITLDTVYALTCSLR